MQKTTALLLVIVMTMMQQEKGLMQVMVLIHLTLPLMTLTCWLKRPWKRRASVLTLEATGAQLDNTYVGHLRNQDIFSHGQVDLELDLFRVELFELRTQPSLDIHI